MATSPTTPPIITSFSGPAPSRTDPTTFSARTNARLGEWQSNVDETNAAITWENSTAQEVYDNAVEANASAVSASLSEASAATSAITAASAAIDFTATSATSLLIGTGSKVFAIETGKAFVPGQIVKAASIANTANEMVGEITSASSGSITVLVTQASGSGTFGDWSISINSVTINDAAASTSVAWSGSKISAELALKADLASPAFTGSPTAPNQASTDSSTKLATTQFFRSAIATSTLNGTIKVRLNGTTAFLTNNGVDA